MSEAAVQEQQQQQQQQVVQPQEQQQQQVPQEVVLELETGEVFKGKDYEAVARSLAAAKVEATRTIQTFRKQAEPQEEGFSQEKYWQMFTADPLKAQDYLESHSETGKQIKSVIGELQAIKTESDFKKMAPEYNDTPENNALMLNWLKESGRRGSSDDLFIGYHQLVGSGKMRPKPRGGTGPINPNPTLPNAGAAPGGQEGDDFSHLSKADLEKKLREAGLKSW